MPLSRKALAAVARVEVEAALVAVQAAENREAVRSLAAVVPARAAWDQTERAAPLQAAAAGRLRGSPQRPLVQVAQ